MPNQEDYDPGLKYGNVLITNDIAAENVTAPKIGATAVSGSQITTGIGYFSIGITNALTTDTTNVNVFGAGGFGVAASITGFYASPLDSTFVTNVGLETTDASVGTVVITGTATTTSARLDAELANTTLAAGTQLMLRKDSDGAVMAIITFEVD